MKGQIKHFFKSVSHLALSLVPADRLSWQVFLSWSPLGKGSLLMGGWEVSVGVSGGDGWAAHSSCLAEAGRLAFWSLLYVRA